MRNIMLFAVGTLLLSGCVSTQNNEVVQDDPYYAPMYPEPNMESVVATGSLFSTQLSNDLYADKKALRTGDIITVKLQESTQATKAAKTETDKQTDASLDPVIGLGGLPVNIGGDSIQFGVGSDASFKGDSRSNQSNSLVGDISVNVMRVLPNGNLVIRGEKWLTLNTGEEFIRLEGLVRPQDVNADNTVESNRIANARIQYSGKGQTQEAQSPGWLTRFFSSSLFPF
ncbi:MULTISPECIES: flagellar basal body L-ring protein FlgH [Pseudoalteromonas]|uniref:flagellar basal body L-ring protein FlgH n=1 Tax=Pseudoalteromonas TaxID=53246 RepID=UPI0002316D3C|nr:MULTISPECIES: flagellar basal body L-ring protein FlgH [unclassified Pseudoalteromonas]TMP45955.1 flagellar basal body L-ring protein FlgH [Pseudoalteromonas sp. S1688]TMS93186.1 flagellar basal body L-ring protein FlgH [Pseudoalteromonas sp. S201]GAA64597.1 flagellar L-ring protein precursor FlgH [Pseudoalteromonas sp. BSi20311]GAA70933.1 flagellar L-ring protein precursor FlgH [Pseudoalteromonas sp. BSi20439]